MGGRYHSLICLCSQRMRPAERLPNLLMSGLMAVNFLQMLIAAKVPELAAIAQKAVEEDNMAVVVSNHLLPLVVAV